MWKHNTPNDMVMWLVFGKQISGCLQDLPVKGDVFHSRAPGGVINCWVITSVSYFTDMKGGYTADVEWINTIRKWEQAFLPGPSYEDTEE